MDILPTEEAMACQLDLFPMAVALFTTRDLPPCHHCRLFTLIQQTPLGLTLALFSFAVVSSSVWSI
jgi:hypothetical protein